MRQAGILAAAGTYALNNMFDRLEEDHFNAQLLSDEIANIPGIEIDNKKIFTNIIFFKLCSNKIDNKKFLDALLKNKLMVDYKGNDTFRAVTHFGITMQEITKTVEIFKQILK